MDENPLQKPRKIRKVLRSKQVVEGAGVHLKRAFGFSEAPQFDPFLLLDDFRSHSPEEYISGFPWHPHRGIETITYVLKGDVEHGDSMNNKGVITSGDVQWMTAGSGVIHQEMPQGDAQGRMEGFQLWANLPAANKMMAPRYRDVKAEQIPTVRLENNVLVKVICGRVKGTSGPVKDIVTDPEYLDITVPPETTYLHPTIDGHTVLAYVIGGGGYFSADKKPLSLAREGENYSDRQHQAIADDTTLVLFEDGDHVSISTGDTSMRLLLVSGKPIGEPVAWHGPIVMNTREEIKKAFEEYEKGTFIK